MITLRFKIKILIMLFSILGSRSVLAQGTITFNEPWAEHGEGRLSLRSFDGFSFRIGNWGPEINNMVHVGAKGTEGYPYNNTPFLAFINTKGTPQYILFALTDAADFGDYNFVAGDPFGLVSVDLADPVAPSLAPIDITFNGFRADGSMVSQTFTVGGGNSSSFTRYYFSSDFSQGLVRVEIPSSAWAMDNIVWVPEPSSYALLGLGSVILAVRASRLYRKQLN